MSLSENIKNLRKEKGLSQQGLADAVYVSRSAVAKWENGLGVPSEANLESMASYFKVMITDITGEPSDWAKEVERIQASYKKSFIKNICISISAGLVFVALILFVIFTVPHYGKNKLITVRTKAGEDVSLVITKQYSLFQDGEVYVDDYTSDILEDIVSFKNGVLYRRYKITSMNASVSSDTFYVPEYVTSFKTYDSRGGMKDINVSISAKHTYKYIKVSPENKLYDSENDCNCLIETASGHLILGCEASVIPFGVTEIVSYSFHSCTPLNLIIPSSVKKIDSDAFSKGSFETVNVTLEEGIEEIEENAFNYIKMDNLILPLSIKKLSPYFIHSGAYNKVYYKGGMEELKSIVTGNYEPSYNDIKDYEGTVGLDGYLTIVYFYSEYEPVNKENLWHYDEEGNPVLWINEK